MSPNPRIGMYKNGRSNGRPWLTEAWGWKANELFLKRAARFDVVIESPQPFGISGSGNDRWFLIEGLRDLKPEGERVAHVMPTLHASVVAADTTYYGRLEAAFPRALRAKDGAGVPTDYVDLIADWSRLLDFWKQEVMGQTFNDGTRVWNSLLIDMLWRTPPAGVDWRVHGFVSKESHSAAWVKAFDALWARVPRVFPQTPVYGNTPGVFPVNQAGRLCEGWDDQGGGLNAVMAAQAKGLCQKPLLFAASNNLGAPTPNGDSKSEAFLKRWRYVCACTALTDGVAIMEPGEPEDDKWEWLEWELPVYDVGAPVGKAWREGSAVRRRFSVGEAVVVRDVVVGGRAYAVQEGWLTG